MVLLRAFVLLLVGAGIGAAYHELGPAIDFERDLGENPPLPSSDPASDGDAGGEAEGTEPEAGGDSGEGASPEDGPGDASDGAGEPGDASADADGPGEAASSPEAPLAYEDIASSTLIGLDGAALIYEMSLSGEASVVDARRLEDYVEGHVPMARHITPSMVRGGNIPEAVEFMDPSAPVMIYCTGGDCDDSHIVGEKLREIGFQRLHIFEGGWPEWQAAGYEVETGEPF